MAEFTISSTSSGTSPTGMGFQTRVIYAANAGAWWAFWLSAGTTIATAYSTNGGSTWTTAGTHTTTDQVGSESSSVITTDGRGLSVTYANISSNDVVHCGWGGWDSSGVPHHMHVRATISGTAITWGSDTDVLAGSTSLGSFANPPEGAAVAITANHKPIDGANYSNIGGNEEAVSVATFPNADTGSAWTVGSPTGGAIFVPSGAPGSAWTASLASGDNAVFIGDNGNGSPGWTNLEYSVWNGSTWGTTGAVLASALGANADPNDWGAVVLDSTHILVVWRNSTTNIQYRIGTISSQSISWTTAAALPTTGLTQPASGTSGFALISDGTKNVWLFVIDSGSGTPVKYSNFNTATSGAWSSGSWGAWTTFESTSVARTYIGISQQNDGSGSLNYLVYWSESAGVHGELFATSSGIALTFTLSGIGSITTNIQNLIPDATFAGVGALNVTVTITSLGTIDPLHHARWPNPQRLFQRNAFVWQEHNYNGINNNDFAFAALEEFYGNGTNVDLLNFYLNPRTAAPNAPSRLTTTTGMVWEPHNANGLNANDVTTGLQQEFYGILWRTAASHPTFFGAGSVNFVGSGSLAVSGPTTGLSAVTLSGIGSLAVTVTVTNALTVTFPGIGSLTMPEGVTTGLSAVTLAGVGALLATPTVTKALAPTFVGVGALTITVTVTNALTVTFPGIGSINATGLVNINPSPTFLGIGAINITVTVTNALTVTFAGQGEIVWNPGPTLTPLFAGIGSFVVAPEANINPSPSFLGQGALNVTVTVTNALTPTFVGQGSLTVTGLVNINPAPTFVGHGALNVIVVATLVLPAVTFAGQGVLGSTVTVTNALSPSLVGLGAFAATVTVTEVVPAFTLLGSGALTIFIFIQTVIFRPIGATALGGAAFGSAVLSPFEPDATTSLSSIREVTS